MYKQKYSENLTARTCSICGCHRDDHPNNICLECQLEQYANEYWMLHSKAIRDHQSPLSRYQLFELVKDWWVKAHWELDNQGGFVTEIGGHHSNSKLPVLFTLPENLYDYFILI